MTIEKAIEILNEYLKEGYKMTADDLHGAMLLGNEALKAIRLYRKTGAREVLNELPKEEQ